MLRARSPKHSADGGGYGLPSNQRDLELWRVTGASARKNFHSVLEGPIQLGLATSSWMSFKMARSRHRRAREAQLGHEMQAG
jgi:hypothetical protein